jgi:hypothetical protein
MDALVSREVQGTFSESPAFGFALPYTQTDQPGREDLANFGQALGGGHEVRVKGVRSGHGCALLLLFQVSTQARPKPSHRRRTSSLAGALVQCFSRFVTTQ